MRRTHTKQRVRKQSWFSLLKVFLAGLGTLFVIWRNEHAIRQRSFASLWQNDKEANLTATSPLSQLELFVTTFPGGLEEFQTTLIASLEFLWPGPINMTVVLDDSIIQSPSKPATYWNNQIQSLFSSTNRIRVVWNPRSDTTLYGPGWSIQQLVMLWADNFTDAPYIGFVDDDTIVTKAVQEWDLFDEDGRPRAIVRYQAVGGPHGDMTIQQHYKSWEAFGERSFIYAMSYFPVIVKRNHLPGIRQAMLDAHPEFTNFDELFRGLFPHTMFSQFMLMMDHLWRFHRNEYSWHFEPFRWNRPHQTLPLPPSVQPKSPAENGVTLVMMRPFPRCMMHANYMAHARRTPRKELVHTTLQSAYCMSLPPQETDERCNKLETNYYIYEWGFEELLYGFQWPVYNPDGVHRAHEARRARNEPRPWRKDLLNKVFG